MNLSFIRVIVFLLRGEIIFFTIHIILKMLMIKFIVIAIIIITGRHGNILKCSNGRKFPSPNPSISIHGDNCKGWSS